MSVAYVKTHAMACLNARVGVSKCLWRCEKVLEMIIRNARFLGKKSCILTHKTMHLNTRMEIEWKIITRLQILTMRMVEI